MLTFITNECMPLDKMVARVQKQNPNDDSYLLVKKAYEFAENAHSCQIRKSGEPYFMHPASVASILTDLMIDPPTIAAGLLHDTVEDCSNVDLDTIRKEFGEEVASLVDGVTKLDKLDFSNREEQKAESLRKMILAMSKDIRVVIIKLADRLHNMRTLKFPAAGTAKGHRAETLDIFTPLAHRLGMNAVKQELEDLCFKYLEPEAYYDIAHKVGLRRIEREENVRMVIQSLSEKLDEHNIHYEIDGRSKHLYSIYRKMIEQNKTFEQIYDLIAVRVLVDTVQDCYAVLGIVHTLWNQIPGRFQGLHLRAQGQHVPKPAHHFDRRAHHAVPVRAADPHLGNAPRGGVRRRGALALQGRREGRRSGQQALLAAPDIGLAKRHPRFQGVYRQPENRPVLRRGSPLHAQGRYHFHAARLHAHRFRLPHPLGRGQPLRGREGQRPHRAAGNGAGNRRPRGYHHLGQLQRPQHGLDEDRQNPAGALQDPPILQERTARRKHGARPRDAGARGQAPRRADSHAFKA